MIKRLLVSIVPALLVWGLCGSLVYAISGPTSLSLTTPVQAYQNLLETGDILFVVKYNIAYGSNPDENITEAYLGRLLDASDEPVGTVQPYAYYDDGYGDGIFSLYFSPGGATWGGTYTMQLIGNPGLSWSGDVPVVNATSLNWNDSNSGFGTYVLTLADELEVAWNVNLVQSTASGLRLTSTYGEAYFTNAIPNLRVFAPGIFATTVEDPLFVEEEHPLTYLEQLGNRWLGTDYNTAINNLADYFSLPRNFFTGGFWLFLTGVMSYFIVRTTHSAKPLPLFLILMVILGTLSGFVTALVPILMAAAFILFIGFVIFYRSGT